VDKRVFIVFLLLIALGFPIASVNASSPGQEASVLVTGDWAYNAIADLGEGRPIPGFVVLQEMTRNQSALMVARLLEHLAGEEQAKSRRFGVSRDVYLDNIILKYNERAPKEQALTSGQVESLYRLALEFRHELEILGYAIQDFELLTEPAWELTSLGLSAKRPLIYSKEAVAAVRRLQGSAVEEESSAGLWPAVAEDRETAADSGPLAENRSLWTGSFRGRVPALPGANIFVAALPDEAEEERWLRLGGLEFSGGIRPVLSGTQPHEDLPLAEGGAVYGLSVKLGDLALKTAVDHLALDEDQARKIISTSVDLSMGWFDLFTVSAGYKHIDGLQEFLDDDPVLATTTSLGVEVPITRGKVSLDLSQRWPKLSASEKDEFSPKNMAELGLSYEFNNDSALRFNYKFIDFSSVEHDYGATAEFSIKF